MVWKLSLLFVLGSLACDTHANAAPEDSSRLITVNRILIVGNKITRDRIITRELSVKSGDTLRFYQLRAFLPLDRNKIYNLRLFNTVEIRALEIGPSQVDLLIEVSERWYTFPLPVFELSDRNFNEWVQNYNADLSRVNYGIKLYQYNFRGRNETLRIGAQFGFSREFDLSYRIPNLDRQQKHGLRFDLGYSEPKNLAYFTNDHKLEFLRLDQSVRVSRSASITYSYRRNFYQTHSFSVGYRNADVIDSLPKLNPNYYTNGATKQQYLTLTYSFDFNRQDVFAYPLNGFRLYAFLSQNGFTTDRGVKQTEVNLTYARYLNLGKNFYLSNFTAGYWSNPARQPYSLYAALGYGNQFIRGYEIYVVEGSQFLINKTTLKKRIFSRTWRLEGMPLEQFRHFPLAIYWKVYGDIGRVENYPQYEEENINQRLSNRFLAGWGSGLDLVLAYDAVIRLEYTFTRESTQGFFFHLKKEF